MEKTAMEVLASEMTLHDYYVGQALCGMAHQTLAMDADRVDLVRRAREIATTTLSQRSRANRHLEK